jgi:hypothetical protein
LNNPTMTEAVVGAGIGFALNTLSGQMQDLPYFTTGFPVIDNAATTMQFFLTGEQFFKYVNSGEARTQITQKP